ncbi:FkbM family methyltransferase [Falsiroseomonas sp. HW251]|uniref:FkbM family methyltransferase n=1 Tax=Falsiroseomonas sp. HW251 TaxID=3390998 RepID=UPI003D31E9D7
MQETSRAFAALARLRAAGFAPEAILDIGAYRGEWAIAARRLFPEAHIRLLDALEENAVALATAAARIGNATAGIAVLGREDGVERDFHVVHAGVQTGSSLYAENTRFPREARRVVQRSLAARLAGDPRHYALAKLDVQGAELDILRGAGSRLEALEAVQMEVALRPYNAGAPLIAEVLAGMEAMGFTAFDILDDIRLPGQGLLVQVDMLFLRHGSRFVPAPPF